MSQLYTPRRDSFCMTDPEMHTEGQDNMKNRVEGKENAHFQRKSKDGVKHEKPLLSEKSGISCGFPFPLPDSSCHFTG